MSQENIGTAENLNNVMKERREKLEALRSQGQDRSLLWPFLLGLTNHQIPGRDS
jgi:hypothetical protein